MKTIAALIIQITLVFGLVMVVTFVESIPYNVRELFSGNHSMVTGILFLCIFNLILGFPVLLAYGLSQCRRWRAALFFSPAVWICGGLVFGFLIFAVPMESIHDVVGSPVLSWPWKWEQAYRFVFLTAPFLCLWTGSAILAKVSFSIGEKDKPGVIYWIFNTIFLLFLSYLVVVKFAATNNLVELLENRGGLVPCLMIGLWITLIGAVPSIICAQSVFRRGSIPMAVLLVLVSLPLGYYLLDFALVDDLHKYGSQFSGLQFLLSTDRSNYATGIDLILRYTLIHVLLNLMMSIFQLPFWEFWKTKAK